MGRRKLLSKEEYTKIKQLVDLNVMSQVQIAEYTKRATNTIYYINRSKNYDDYQAIHRSYKVVKPVKQNAVDRSDLLDERNPAKKTETRSEQAALADLTNRVKNVESMLETLVKIFEQKEAAANVSFWKRGK